MSKTNQATLRMAAIAAVIAEVTQQGDDPGQIARQTRPCLVSRSPQNQHWAIKPHAPQSEPLSMEVNQCPKLEK